MAKKINEYEEITDKGLSIVKEFSNGIKVKLLKTPSDEYKNKMKLNYEKELELAKIQRKKDEAKVLIKTRMEENAKRQLIEEGLLNENGELADD